MDLIYSEESYVTLQAGDDDVVGGEELSLFTATICRLFSSGSKTKRPPSRWPLETAPASPGSLMEEIDDVEKFGLLEGQMMEGHE